MSVIIPALLKKKITFKRLPVRHVSKYEVYAEYKDDNYASGIRTELLDTIENPAMPTPVTKKIELAYNDNATWKLPDDAYLDRDHQFKIYLNGFILSSVCYAFNRITKLITIDTVMKKYEINDKVEMEYWLDVISKEYVLEENCNIKVKPIFNESYSYGDHNIII